MNALLLVLMVTRPDTGAGERIARWTAAGLTVVDGAQTLAMPRQGYHEAWNPLLGRTPSPAGVVAYFTGATGVLTLLVPRIRHRRVRQLITGAWLLTEVIAVGHNHAIGVRIRY